jgi:transcriptional regulator with XRE-family HTH domain/mannose-6-phosphate isomerase-like protein (cupin superfamily)
MASIGSKLKHFRKQNRLSLRDVAARAGISASMLSQIETGKVNPSVMSLYNIANALGVPVAELFPDEDKPQAKTKPVPNGLNAVDKMAGYAPIPQKVLPLTPSGMRDAALLKPEDADIAFGDDSCDDACVLTRRADRPTINLMHGVTWARLTRQPEPGIEFLELSYVPGASSGPAMSSHNGREWGMVIDGELMLELGFDIHVLRPGDCIIFDSQTPHRLNNRGATTMKAIWVVFNQPRTAP